MGGLCVVLGGRGQVRLILLIFVLKEGRVVVLLHVGLGRLVDVQLGHLFRSLLCSLLCCHLGLLLLLFLLLDSLELLENILVVEQRVREFVPEQVTREEAFDAALKHRHLQQLVDGGPLCRVPLEHHGDDV